MKKSLPPAMTGIHKKKQLYAFFLSLPPLLALGMIGIVSVTSKTLVLAPQGVFLSPIADASPLILSLVIFVLGYVFFIGLLFKDSFAYFLDHKIMHRKRLP